MKPIVGTATMNDLVRMANEALKGEGRTKSPQRTSLDTSLQ